MASRKAQDRFFRLALRLQRRRPTKTEDMPEFLSGIRARAESFATLPPGSLQQVLLTEYSPGAAIGWHKDRSVFGNGVGISVLSSSLSACASRQATGGSGAI
jgi:alkylated DNA repair dioxygenase AlkB